MSNASDTVIPLIRFLIIAAGKRQLLMLDSIKSLSKSLDSVPTNILFTTIWFGWGYFSDSWMMDILELAKINGVGKQRMVNVKKTKEKTIEERELEVNIIDWNWNCR